MHQGQIDRLDLALSGLLILSLASTFAWEWVGGFVVFGLGLAATTFFAVPLSDAFLKGKASVRNWTKDQSAGSPRAVFQESLRPRRSTWLALGLLYYASLAARFYFFAKGMNFILTVPSVGLVLLMVPSCSLGLRETSELWKLTVLTLALPTVSFLVLWGISYRVMDTFDLWTGYSDIGLAFIPPMVAGAVLVVASAGLWIWIRRQGDAWYETLL